MMLSSSCFTARIAVGVGIALALLATVGATTTACGDDTAEGRPEANVEAGAGGSSGAAPAPAPSRNEPVPRERFGEVLAAALCEGVEACCANAGYPDAPKNCTPESPDAGAPEADVPPFDDPTLNYDPQAAADCLATLRRRNQQCTVPSNPDPRAYAKQVAASLDTEGVLACTRVISGTKKLGEPCRPGECAPSENPEAITFCGLMPLADGGTTNACKMYQYGAPVGARCDVEPSRATTPTIVFCGPASQELTVFTPAEAIVCDPETATCQPGSTVFVGEGQSCSQRYCAVGLYCASATKTCVKRVAEGASCAGGASCVDGTGCNASKICEVRKADGQPCTSSSECLGDCNAKKVCAPRRTGYADQRRCGG